MLAILRWFLKIFEKEHLLRTRYHRGHPHFLIYMALDVVLSIALVVGGFELATSDSPPPKLVNAGAVAMPVGEFIDHVKKNRINAYWLGSVSGHEYTINHQESGVAKIFYRPKGQTNMKLFLYKVNTYKNELVWERDTHTPLATVGTTTITTTGGLTIRINLTYMRDECVTFRDRPEIVQILYRAPQSRETMIRNAESLKSIK